MNRAPRLYDGIQRLLQWILKLVSSMIDRQLPELYFASHDIDMLAYDPVATLMREENHAIVYGSHEEGDSSMDTNVSYIVDQTTFSGKYGTLIRMGRATLTYPSDLKHAHMIHEWIDHHICFRRPLDLLSMSEFSKSPWIVDETLHSATETFLRNVHIPKYLTILENEYSVHTYLARMDKTSIADLLWISEVKWLIENGWVDDALEEYPEICHRVYKKNESDEECTDKEESDDYTDDEEVNNHVQEEGEGTTQEANENTKEDKNEMEKKSD